MMRLRDDHTTYRVLTCQGGCVAGCSDRLAVGATAVCLRFCRPFLGGDDKFMARLDPAFYHQQAFRWACSRDGSQAP